MTANGAATGTHGWTASRRSDLDYAFRRAGRHSLLVRILRIAVPLGVVVGLASVMIVTWFNPMRVLDKLPSMSRLAISGSKITMELPRVAGFTRDSRAYELTAKTAVQDITAPDLIELKDLNAKMDMQDGSAVHLTALGGLYQPKADRLTLREDVVVVSSAGYRARLSEAAVNMKEGHIVSEKPVEITLPNGVLNANRLEIVESGDVIRFDRGVVMTLWPAKEADSRPTRGAPRP